MIETQRLRMRPFTRDDLSWLIEMRTRPEVYKYLGGVKLQNPESISARLDFYISCYEKFGFGSCAMIFKDTDQPIGFSGLQPLEDTGEIEVGYSLLPEYWRMGLGYECAMGWLNHGFNAVGLEKIVAIAVKENIGSWKIMEKCGMKYHGIEEHYGLPVVCYSIEKADFNSNQASNRLS